MKTEPVLLHELILKIAESHPEIPALGFAGEESYSYASAAALVDRLAARLVEDGIRPGERVAILGENMPHWGIAYLAINRCGGVAIPVLPDFPAADIGRILDHAQIRGIFLSRRLAAKAGECGIDPDSVTIYLMDTLNRMEAANTESAEKALEAAGKPELPPEGYSYQGAADDLAVIIYTSGTTGHSKGVMLSNRNIVFDVVKTSVIPGMRPGDAMISILPLAHTYECSIGFLIPLYMGCSIYYLRRPPSATVLMPALQKVRPHLMLSVPLLIEKLYRQSVLPSFRKSPILKRIYATGPGRKLLNRLAGRKLRRAFGGRLYFFGIGGAALSPEVEDFLIEARFPYSIGYGLTETAPLIAGANHKGMRPRSTGKPIEGIEVKILDPKPETGEGEIVVKGPIVMQGYYRDPDRTAEVLDGDGWFHTGDLGIFDDDGWLYIKGRVKNMILGPSGENIYPEAIESIINSFEFVEDSLVFQYQGEILARIHLNYDSLKEHLQNLAESAGEFPREAGEFMTELRKNVNNRLSSFARIGKVIEQREPFGEDPDQEDQALSLRYSPRHPPFEGQGAGRQAAGRSVRDKTDLRRLNPLQRCFEAFVPDAFFLEGGKQHLFRPLRRDPASAGCRLPLQRQAAELRSHRRRPLPPACAGSR